MCGNVSMYTRVCTSVYVCALLGDSINLVFFLKKNYNLLSCANMVLHTLDMLILPATLWVSGDCACFADEENKAPQRSKFLAQGNS